MLKQFLTKEVIQGVMRHGLTTLGGILIAKGMTSPEKVDSVTKAVTSPECIGAIITLIGVIKSCLAKQQPPAPEQAAVVTLVAPKQQP